MAGKKKRAKIPAAGSVPGPEQVRVIPVGPLPLIKAMLDELGVIEIINSQVPSGSDEYDLGTVAAVVSASRLQGTPLPIYEIEKWAAEGAVPFVFGIPAEKLNDDRIGGMLDRIRPKWSAIWGRVIARAVMRFGVEMKTLHVDPTKIAFEGSYAGQDDLPPEVPRISYGKPKDGQVDRKLLTLSAVVSEDGGIPGWFGLEDGNCADDHTYLQDLRELRTALPELGPLVIGGDSKLPSAENLSQLCRWEYQFVATEAWRAARRERLTKLLRRGAHWQALSYVASADRRKPVAEQGRYECIVDVGELTDPKTHVRYAVRRLYIRSSRKAERTQATRERQIAAVQAELERIKGLLNKYDYTTLDIVRARVGKALRLNRTGRYFEVQVTKTRAGQAPLHMTWKLVSARVRAEARWDGIYVIITNLPEATHTPDAVMDIYKDQYHVEWRFRDVNQLPIQVRPLWLKNPARIEALVFLVMLAVLVFALLERQVRRAIAASGQLIVGLMPEKRDTPRPKGQRLLRAFQYLSVVEFKTPRGQHYYLSELTPVQRQIVQALGLADLASYLAGLATQLSQAQALPQG